MKRGSGHPVGGVAGLYFTLAGAGKSIVTWAALGKSMLTWSSPGRPIMTDHLSHSGKVNADLIQSRKANNYSHELMREGDKCHHRQVVSFFFWLKKYLKWLLIDKAFKQIKILRPFVRDRWILNIFLLYTFIQFLSNSLFLQVNHNFIYGSTRLRKGDMQFNTNAVFPRTI